MIALIVIAVYLYSCTRKANVTVTCLDLGKFHTNLGVLNEPAYPLGKILKLDGEQVQGLRTLATNDQDLANPGPLEDKTIKLNTELNLEFDTEVPASIKAKVESTLRNALIVELKRMVRHDLADPIALANARADLKQQIKAFNGSATKVVLVSTIKRADDLKIKLSDGTEVKGDANLIKVSNFQITANYKCDGLYKVLGEQTGVLYGVRWCPCPLKSRSVRSANGSQNPTKCALWMRQGGVPNANRRTSLSVNAAFQIAASATAPSSQYAGVESAVLLIRKLFNPATVVAPAFVALLPPSMYTRRSLFAANIPQA